MAQNGADVHLILLRPTRVPVVGESVSHLFQGQVVLESLTWNLRNEDEAKLARSRDKSFDRIKSVVDRQGSSELRSKHAFEDYERASEKAEKKYQKALAAADLMKDTNEADAARSEAHEEYLKRREEADKDYKRRNEEILGVKARKELLSEKELRDKDRDKAIREADRNRNHEFTFTKSVDIATTQMLNSMKAGDIFPSATLTLHKRSDTVIDGTSLIFTIQKVRLLDYRLQVSVTDTMTEMTESWTAEFAALAYIYKNAPPHYTSSSVTQAAVKAATQGTLRAFTMKNIGSPI